MAARAQEHTRRYRLRVAVRSNGADRVGVTRTGVENLELPAASGDAAGFLFVGSTQVEIIFPLHR
jgi:hypothetical protein